MNPVQESDKLQFESTLQLSSMRLPCNTCRSEKQTLVRSVYVSGMEMFLHSAHKVGLEVQCGHGV